MTRSKIKYEIECYVVRATYRAVLLTPATVRQNKIRDGVGAMIQEWFPSAYVEVGDGPPYSDYVNETVVVTIPEWLVNEKGWEDYV